MDNILWLRLAFSLGTFMVLALGTRWLFRRYVSTQAVPIKLALGVGTLCAGILLVCSVMGVGMNILAITAALSTP